MKVSSAISVFNINKTDTVNKKLYVWPAYPNKPVEKIGKILSNKYKVNYNSKIKNANDDLYLQRDGKIQKKLNYLPGSFFDAYF